jgi:hypothetical protein
MEDLESLMSMYTGEVMAILVSDSFPPKIYPASLRNPLPESSLYVFAEEYTVARVAVG